MANIKLGLRLTKRGDGIVCYHIILPTSRRIISSELRIKPNEWDSANNRIITPTPQHLTHIETQIYRDVARLKQIIRHMELHHNTFKASDVAVYFKRSYAHHPFTEFAYEIINQLRQSGHIRTSETYQSMVISFCKFRQYVMLEDINSELIRSYESWMRQQGLTMNTCSFYMRILRAIYNRAIDRGFVEYNNPFRHVYTGIDKTLKRALDLRTIRRLKALDISSKPTLSLARDIFMFSFYTRGMSFVDIAFLRKSDLSHGVLRYRRRKTNQPLIVRWEKCMQEVVERYDTSNSPYLLPIITRAGDERNQYLKASSKINRDLKVLGKMLGLQMPLTMYVARHSWATIARDKRIPISIISESMGHESEMTTRIYLSSISHHEIDRANHSILMSL